MGKKSFVDKKSATSYRLIHRPTLNSDSVPELQWVETSRNIGIGRPDIQGVATAVHDAARQSSDFHPLAWLRQEQDEISEERRQEIIKLGFPDDGYDYLKHLRQVGRPQAAVAVGTAQGSDVIDGEQQPEASAPPQEREQASGPAVFLPADIVEKPPEDHKTYDASRLTVHQSAQDDDEATLIAGGVTAFSRELYNVRRKHQLEVDEMEQLMRQLEDAEGSDVNEDLENDFVLAATEMAHEAEDGQGAAQRLPLVSVADEEDEEEVDEEDSQASSSDDFHPGGAPSEHKSFASTYWRPERTDRKGALSIIDERFERLALEYDSDEIGELDELEDDPTARGPASTDQFRGVMDEFLAVHATQDHAHEGGQLYHTAAVTSHADGTREDAALAAAALAKAKEHLRMLEEQEEAGPTSREEDESYEQPEEAPRDAWDCESVLSTRSTLYNHPTRIDSGGRRRAREDPRTIRLSRKTGLPVSREACAEEEDADEQASVGGASLAAPPRRKDETVEEKKARKEAVKDVKRQARMHKKELKGMFKEEALRQHRRLSAPAPTTVSFA